MKASRQFYTAIRSVFSTIFGKLSRESRHTDKQLKTKRVHKIDVEPHECRGRHRAFTYRSHKSKTKRRRLLQQEAAIMLPYRAGLKALSVSVQDMTKIMSLVERRKRIA